MNGVYRELKWMSSNRECMCICAGWKRRRNRRRRRGGYYYEDLEDNQSAFPWRGC